MPCLIWALHPMGEVRRYMSALNRVDGIPLEADEGSSDGPPVVDTENGRGDSASQ